jgi:hypothetical protein
LNVLVAACRFDLDRSHDGSTDRIERYDKRSQFLAEAVYRSLHTERALPKALPADKE